MLYHVIIVFYALCVKRLGYKQSLFEREPEKRKYHQVTTDSFQRMGMKAIANILSILDNEKPDPSCVLNEEVL